MAAGAHRPSNYLVSLLAVVSVGVLALPAFGSMPGDPASPALDVTQAAPRTTPGRGTPHDDRAHGYVWSGLSAGGACGPAYEVANAPGLCSHGPDAAPSGETVDARPTTSELQETAAASSTTSSSAGVPCYGDGVTGNRVQAVYAVASDVTDRYADIAPLVAQWAGAVDGVFADSAAETGGVRHVRWVTTAGCSLDVLHVQLSSRGDDDYSSTVSELQSLGLNRTDRKYVVWVDAYTYCGISAMAADDSASVRNANNTGPGYARIDSGCWGKSSPVEAHELMHTLGGVQYTAPHTSGGGHCTDDYDRMCYADSSGVVMTYPCASTHERLFDCNHDDYFHTAPPTGSYLATHWNTAMSSFLESTEPTTSSTTTAPTSTTTTAPTSTTTVAPTTTTTAPATASASSITSTSWSGSLSRKSPSKTFRIDAGAGDVDATVTFSGGSTVTLGVATTSGTTIAQSSGGSAVVVTASVSGGSYDVVVSSGGSSVKFKLSVTYAAP
jgi:hypothetical protein